MKPITPFIQTLAFIVATTFTTVAAAQMTLKLAHFAEAGHPANQSALQFAQRVEARTKGQVKVSVFPANALGSPPEQLQQVKLGVIYMGLTTQGALDKYNKAFAVVMLPFVFEDTAHAHRVLEGPAMDWLAPLAEKDGFVLLSNWEYGFRNLTNNKLPINKPADLKGLKIRVPPEVQLEAAMEALDANVTKIAFPELYMALSKGVVDGEENPIAVIVHNKFYEVQKHLALTRHAYNSMVHVISTKTWGKLSPEQRDIIKQESRLAGDLMCKTIAAEEDAQIAKLQTQGMQVTRPDPKLFRDAMAPAYKKIAVYAGDANVQQFMRMVEAQRNK